MKQTKLNALLLIGIIGVFTVGSNFSVHMYRAFGGDQDIWWTARTMPLSVDEIKDSFELFIDNKSIHKHLSDGTLQVLLKNGNHKRIVSSDINFRINNWSKVKSSILTNSLLPCFLFSASLTMLVIGLIQVFSKKNSDCQQGDSPEVPMSRG
jgi:hypothetical protein